MMKKHINIPIFIPHLGCPFDCIFCNQKKIAATLNPPIPQQVAAIIEEHLKTIATESEVEVAFFGGSFTAINEGIQIQYLEAVQAYIKDGQVESIRISTRPDFITPKILETLQKYRVQTIELGVQSLNDEVLKKSCRGYSVDDVFKASRLIKKHNIKLGVQLMIGLPGDTREIAIETANKAVTLQPDIVRIYPTLVIKDTVLAEMYAAGKYQPLKLEEAVTTTKEMYLQFKTHNIPVIRMGLYPSEELQTGEAVLAGPFHPAFGELVEQEIFYDQAKRIIDKLEGDFDKITIYVNPRDISKMVGNKRQNVIKLRDLYSLSEVMVKGAGLLEMGEIEVEAQLHH